MLIQDDLHAPIQCLTKWHLILQPTSMSISPSNTHHHIQPTFRPNSYTQVATYTSATGEMLSRTGRQGYGPESTWSRGQAWAIHGFTMFFRCVGAAGRAWAEPLCLGTNSFAFWQMAV